jgi:predicted RecA/RadA family phage recombinase
MGTTFIQDGDVLELAAPSGGCTSGLVYIIAGIAGIAQFTVSSSAASAGARTTFYVEGVHTLPKASSETWTEGQPAYWDATNAQCSTDPTVGLPIGRVALAAASSTTTGAVNLNEVSLTGRMYPIRKRLTVAAINAGATLVPAVPGAKIRLHDMAAIAVGGAVTSVTTVDVKGTQSTSVVKLVAFAQANLTQSAMVRAGGTGGTLLADGASFAPCDANTAITAGITGSSITVATNVDFIGTYSLE